MVVNTAPMELAADPAFPTVLSSFARATTVAMPVNVDDGTSAHQSKKRFRLASADVSTSMDVLVVLSTTKVMLVVWLNTTELMLVVAFSTTGSAGVVRNETMTPLLPG